MNIAILIDAENIDPAYANQIFTYAESMGTIVAREIYGAGIALNEWSAAIFQYVLHTNMTLKPSRFKNSTDIALVIGAMDLLVERATRSTTAEQDTTADAVIIVSSDSDYSALALRLRASGIEVIGMGKEDNVNPSWPMACSEFITLTPVDETRTEGQPKPHVISPPHKADKQASAHGKTRSASSSPESRGHTARVANIRKVISDQLSKNDGQMPSASLFNILKELPDYLCDQKRSKRNPVDYLSRQYSDLLKIQKNSEGVLWAYSKLADAAAVTKARDEGASQQEIPEDAENMASSLVEFLCGAEVDRTDAQKVASAYEECSNMKDAYNVLRRIFKTETGTAYYKLVKQYKENQNKI